MISNDFGGANAPFSFCAKKRIIWNTESVFVLFGFAC